MHLSLALARRTAVALALGASLVAGPARAWEYPLLPHVNGLAFFHDPAVPDSPTRALLSAYYIHEYWEVVDSSQTDSTHVRVTIRRDPTRADSLTSWTRLFDLGVLAPGMHDLTVHCTVQVPGQPDGEEEITVPFEVERGTTGPPPPPPPAMPLLEQVLGTDAIPGEPVVLTLSGYTPYECTLIHGEHTEGQTAIYMTFDHLASCTDTTRHWRREFDMGSFAEGDHDVAIHLIVNDADSTHDYSSTATVHAHASAPPPPAPPAALPLLQTISGTEALPGAPVTLTLSGFTPFACTSIHDEHTAGQEAVFATFSRIASCSDTTRLWARSFALGGFAEGDHPVVINLLVDDADSGYAYRDTIAVHVHASVPPPPPVDSSQAGMSSSHPNPFRDQNSFGVSLDQAQMVDVAVFDLLGRRVVTIHHGMLPEGTSRLAWNGRRQDGSRAPGGVYFYRLTLGSRVIHRQVVLLGTP